MDWTINLWSKRIDSPIMTFEMIDDYVNDLKWHPTNPSVFVSGDCSGKLDLWDLNKDSEAPIFRHEVGKDALNKIAWSSDGKKLSLGDINGKIHIFNVEKEVKFD